MVRGGLSEASDGLGGEFDFPGGDSLLGMPKSLCDSEIEWEATAACQMASTLLACLRWRVAERGWGRPLTPSMCLFLSAPENQEQSQQSQGPSAGEDGQDAAQGRATHGDF